MRTYVFKRTLLMIPTLFGISIVVWLVVTSAPGDPGQIAAGDQTQQQGAGGGQSQRIFRAQFNLDKPRFWNDYPDLTPEEVLEKIRTTIDRDRKVGERGDAAAVLEDWGYYAVPGLVGALDLAETPAEKIAVLVRLQRNAKRIEPTPYGKRLTDEDKRHNREVLAENLEIDRKLKLPRNVTPAAVDEKTAAWKEWYARYEERWAWTGWEKMKLRLFDTKFAKYWSNILTFDLGVSHTHRKPVLDLIKERLRISFALAVSSLVLAYVLSVPLGIWAATKHGTWRERGVTVTLFMAYSLPSFFTATLLLRYLGIGDPASWIPVQGFEGEDTFHMTTWQHARDILWHTVAPIFCLSYASVAALSRYAKSGLLNVIRSDYVRTARAKGLSERVVILKHAVRNGVIPIITLLGTTLPVVVSGSIIIEQVFNIPGIGLLMWEAINQRDYNVVIGISTIVAILTMVGILLSDILYAVVDPRISYS